MEAVFTEWSWGPEIQTERERPRYRQKERQTDTVPKGLIVRGNHKSSSLNVFPFLSQEALPTVYVHLQVGSVKHVQKTAQIKETLE
jgi:hypothetical protein